VKSINYVPVFLFFTICEFFLFVKPAFAYLDPGTGSAILQGVIAAIAAVGIAGKLYWHRILRLLGLKKGKSSTTSTTDMNSGGDE